MEEEPATPATPVVRLGAPRYEQHVDNHDPVNVPVVDRAVAGRDPHKRRSSQLALVPVDQLQPDWPDAEEDDAYELDAVPLTSLFAGIQMRAEEQAQQDTRQEAIDNDVFRRNAIEKRKKERLKNLLRLVEKGNLKQVKEICELGADINAKLHGVTPLIVAVTEGHADVVEYLISDDVEVDMTGRYGMTALHHACHLNNYEVAKMLLQYGANPSPATSYGITPLHICCREGNFSMIRTLLLFGADQFLQDQAGKAPHEYAQTDKVHTYIQEFAGRYMLQVMKQNKELQTLVVQLQHELKVARQQVSMVSEVVEVQRAKAKAKAEKDKGKDDMILALKESARKKQSKTTGSDDEDPVITVENEN